jgi:hypothetical protein
MQLIAERDPEVPVDGACLALNVSRASFYRSRCPAVPSVTRARGPSPRRLPDDERQAILAVFHQPEFADQPPQEVFATLLSRGIYLASIRTMYRVLAEAGETKDRRLQRTPRAHAMPSLTATAPNQVWTWDITKLATTSKGVFLMAYVIIDLFSRFVVGWMVATKECKHLAAQLFAETIARHGIEPGLQVHSDRGSAMTSDTLAQLLDSLGASRSGVGGDDDLGVDEGLGAGALVDEVAGAGLVLDDEAVVEQADGVGVQGGGDELLAVVAEPALELGGEGRLERGVAGDDDAGPTGVGRAREGGQGERGEGERGGFDGAHVHEGVRGRGA